MYPLDLIGRQQPGVNERLADARLGRVFCESIASLIEEGVNQLGFEQSQRDQSFQQSSGRVGDRQRRGRMPQELRERRRADVSGTRLARLRTARPALGSLMGGTAGRVGMHAEPLPWEGSVPGDLAVTSIGRGWGR